MRLPWRFSIVARWRHGIALFLRGQLKYCIIQVPCCTWLIIERHKIAVPSPFYESSAYRNDDCDVNKHVFSGRPDPEQAAVQQQQRLTRRASIPGSIALFATIFSIVRRRSRFTPQNTRPIVRFLFLFYKHSRALCSLHLRCVPLCSSFFFILLIWFISYKPGSPPDRNRRCIATSLSRARHSRPSEMPALLSYPCCVAGFCGPAKILWTFGRRFEAVSSSRRLPVRCSHVPLHLPTPVKPFVEGAALRLTWCSSDMLRAFGGEKPARVLPLYAW